VGDGGRGDPATHVLILEQPLILEWFSIECVGVTQFHTTTVKPKPK